MLFLHMGQPRSFGSKASLLFLLLFANRPQSIHTCIANRFSAHYRLIISHYPSQIHPTIEEKDKRLSLVLSISELAFAISASTASVSQQLSNRFYAKRRSFRILDPTRIEQGGFFLSAIKKKSFNRMTSWNPAATYSPGP